MSNHESISEQLIASVNRELEAFRLADERAAAGLQPQRRRRAFGGSTVVSIRLDQREYDALEARVNEVGVKPSVLARNLVRSGLAHRHGNAIATAVDRVEAALEELRSLVP
jgi:hypothetical protein